MMEPRWDNFERVMLRPVVGGAGLARLSWSIRDGAGRVVQVYVNGRLHDVAEGLEQREMWVRLVWGADVLVELVAVDAREPWRDAREAGWRTMWRRSVEAVIRRDEALPADGWVEVCVDGEVAGGGWMWGGRASRNGWGGLFGAGEFGTDMANGLGDAWGEFGVGGFGWDGAAWRWRSEEPGAGTHAIDVRVVDGGGNVVGTLSGGVEVKIEAIPGAARNVEMGAGFVLRWET